MTLLIVVLNFRYVELNTRYNSSYRAYSEEIPNFLVNRPRELVTHCMKRLEARRSISRCDILMLNNENGCFQIKSQSKNQTYNVNFGSDAKMPHCDCLDWRNNYLPCKHFLSIFFHFPKWNWERLPTQYKDSPLLTLDSHLAQPFQSNDENRMGSLAEDETLADNRHHLPENQKEGKILPLQAKKLSAKSEGAKVRELINQIRSLTFLVDDTQAMNTLYLTLKDAMEEFKKHTISEDGIDLEVKPTAKVKPEKCNNLYHKCDINQRHDVKNGAVHPLPSSKTKHKYSGRVGEVAATMKKMYKVSTSVNDLFTDENDQDRIASKSRNEREVEQMDVDLATKVSPGSSNIDDSASQPSDVEFVEESVGCAPKRKKRTLEKDDVSSIKNGEMLTDNAINIAQNILHHQYPLIGGLEDTVLGPCLNFSVARGKFVQILHDGSLHWVCVSNVGCTEPGSVNVYDSLNKGNIALHIKKQVASMLFHSHAMIKFHVKEVQQQENSVDCGVFAVAYATSILHGQNPEEMVYDTKKLRQYLLTCIRSEKITPFPLTSGKPKSKKKTIKVKLFCSCRMPWDATDKALPDKQMAQCDSCKQWFHRSCEIIPELVFSTNCHWECKTCSNT